MSADVETAPAPSAARLWTALWSVYLVWGSTYLAIRVVVRPESGGHGLPPLLMAGVRFLLAGAVMFALTARRAAADGRPDPLGRRQWAATAVVGTLLLLGGNGFVTLAEQRISSGVAAVVVATVPIWTALLAAVSGAEPVTRRHVVGLALGFAGVAVLVVGEGSGRVDALGVALVCLAAFAWSVGTFWSRSAPLPRRPLVGTAMQMLCGGAALMVAAAVSGDVGRLELSGVAAQSWLGFAYLVVVGSMVGYTAYVWLVANARLSLVTTYAYVNPVVAVILGVVILDESFTTRTALATLAAVLGVILIVTRGQPSARREVDHR